MLGIITEHIFFKSNINMNIQTNITKPPKQDIFKSGKFRSYLIQAIVLILILRIFGSG